MPSKIMNLFFCRKQLKITIYLAARNLFRENARFLQCFHHICLISHANMAVFLSLNINGFSIKIQRLHFQHSFSVSAINICINIYHLNICHFFLNLRSFKDSTLTSFSISKPIRRGKNEENIFGKLKTI